MSDLLLGGSSWWVLPCSLLAVGAAFGLIPGLLLRLIVQMYPKKHPRREELFGELYDPEMGRFARIEWVFQQLETAFREGLSLRGRFRRERRANQKLRRKTRRQLAKADPYGVALAIRWTEERREQARKRFGYLPYHHVVIPTNPDDGACQSDARRQREPTSADHKRAEEPFPNDRLD